MPLSTNSGSGTWNTYPITTTSIIVWPPGFDGDPSRIPILTYRKQVGFTIAVNDFVGFSSDIAGDIATNVGTSYFIRATTAAASGATTVQGQRVPQVAGGNIRFADTQRSDIGWTGNPAVRQENVTRKDLEFLPVNFSSVYGYIDGGGVTHTTGNAATASAGVSYWIEGNVRTSVHPGPSGVDLIRYPVLDSGLTTPPGVSKSDATMTIQAPGIPPGLGGQMYSTPDTSTISGAASTVTPIFIGLLVGIDKRTTPNTYAIQAVPYANHGLNPVYSPIKSGIKTVSFQYGLPLPTMLSARLIQIGMQYDNYVLVTAGANKDRYPTTAIQIFAPLMTNAPDFAVDCTLPAPFGDVRVIWAAGTVQMTKRSSSSTAPRPSMVLSKWNALAAKTYTNDTFGSGDSTVPGTPIGLSRSENGPCPYPLCGWNSAQRYFNSALYENYMAPHRLGIYPANVRLVFHEYLGLGYTSCRLEYGWVRRNASTRVKVDPIGSLTNISSPTNTDAGTSNLVFYDVTIPAPPGGVEDVESYGLKINLYATYSGIESLWVTRYAFHIGISVELANKYSAYDYANIFNKRAEPLGTEGVIMPVTGDPFPLEVWPEDILKWSPFPNDSDCSYVGHDGWRWPNPTAMPAVTKNASSAVTWSAGVLTITAMPGMNWTGNAHVDGPTTTPIPAGRYGYAVRITCASAGLSLQTLPIGASGTASSYNTAGMFWTKSEVSAPIGYAYSAATVVPITIACPKPISSGPVDILIELWEVRLVGTTYGGDAQLANLQRVTVTIP